MSVKLSVLVGFALRALRTNKLRSILTMLGIVIGVASVILIISLGEGFQKEIDAIFSQVNTKAIVVWSNSSSEQLTEGDVEALAQLPGVVLALPSAGCAADLVSQDRRWYMTVEGTTEDQMNFYSLDMEEGRFISQADVLNAAPYVVLGQRPYEELFPPGTDPIGEEIKIKGKPFKVIGLLKSSGTSSLLEDSDNSLYMPISTVKKRLLGSNDDSVDYIWIQAAPSQDLDLAQADILAELNKRHHVNEEEPSVFGINTMEEQLAQITRLTRLVTLFLSAVAGISLLVGGLGIMNIMLVSVTERTREIGVRMAIGASGRDIMLQFLVEAVFVSLMGCSVGIVLGVALGQIAAWIIDWKVPVSLLGILLSAGFSSMVGILFGFYPARRAARMNPAEALGYE